MAGSFSVETDELRAVSRRLAKDSSAMRGVLARLEDGLAEVGAAWGDDELGRRFAEGYLPQANWVSESVDAKCDLLDFYADLLKQAADSFERSDGAYRPRIDDRV